MSVTFAYLGNWAKKSASSKGKIFYKLILAGNRDERYSKRVLPVTFWNNPDSHILADKHVDEQYGTWLGVSKTGLLGNVLRIKRDILNISTDQYIKRRTKRQGDFLVTRAALIPNFLKSHQTHITLQKLAGSNISSSLDFANALCEGSEHSSLIKRFLPFHFIGVDLNPKSDADSIKATYVSNKNSTDINHKSEPIDITPPPGSCEFLGYGNSPIYKPFQKVIHGRIEFMEIVSNYMCSDEGLVVANESNAVAIKKELLHFLRSTKKYLPDPVILEYARGDRMKEKLWNKQSARFVTDFFDSATRSQTIILVDTNNNVSFNEWLLESPIYDPKTSQWIETVHDFKI